MDRLANGETFILRLTGATPVAGGMPIVVGGKLIGAIGISGASALTGSSGRAGRRERCEIKNFTSQLQIRRDKIPADFCFRNYHTQLTAFEMTSPIVSNVAAHTKAETKFAI